MIRSRAKTVCRLFFTANSVACASVKETLGAAL
jgi:hypothetical protein